MNKGQTTMSSKEKLQKDVEQQKSLNDKIATMCQMLADQLIEALKIESPDEADKSDMTMRFNMFVSLLPQYTSGRIVTYHRAN